MKLIRSSTVPQTLNRLCKGLFSELSQKGFEIIAVSSPGKDLDELAKRENVRTIGVPMKRRISPLYDIVSFFRLIILFSREKPHIVHSITPKAGLLSMAAAWTCKVPVRVHTFTGLVFPTSKGLKKRILKLTDSFTCRFATYVLAEGEGVKRDLTNNHITNKEINILGNGSLNGVNLEYFNPELPEVKEAAEKLRDKDVFTFIFVGRLVGDKGVNELVQAFSTLHRERPGTRLFLIGETENSIDPLLSSTLKEIEENPAIEYVGLQEDVRPWLAASDVLVLPSYREGFPNVVLEGAAMGLPCIVTDINGANEIIIDKGTGRIIPPNDIMALKKAMEEIINDPSISREMGIKARKRIISRYDHKKVRKALLNFYNSMDLN